MSDKITYENKVGIKPKTVRINQVQDLDMNEIKDKHNAVESRVTAIESSGVVGVTPINVSAEWSSGLSFDVTAANYPVLNTFYSSTPGVVTLDAADPTLDRIDLIVAIAPVSPATVGTVGFIKGTPATTALVVPPDYDPSLVYVIKQVIVRAAASTPEDTATELVFDENVGHPTEYTFSSNSGNIVVSSNDAFSGSNSIEATNPIQGNKIILTRSSLTSTSNLGLLTFYIKLKADLGQNYIYIKFFNGTTRVGDFYVFNNGQNGFDSSSLSWQKISIDSSKLNLPITDYDIIEIYPYKSFSGYFIDLVQIHEGSGSDVLISGVEEAPIDGKQYARKDAGWVEVEAGGSEYDTRVDMGISNDIDWAKPNGIFLKTLTENTTFTDSNLPNGLNIKRISLHLEPNVFNPIFPNYWELISGDIINNNVNVLKAECVNGTSGSELVRYSVESSINLNDYSGVFNSDSSVINGLIDSNAPFPTTFYKGTELFTIIGRGNGQFTGWKWNINTLIWESNTVIVNGLGDIGSNACPSVFYIDNDLYMIASENLSQVGFKWNTITNNWDSNTGILVGLGNIWGFTAGNMTVFSIGSTHYCIIGGESYRGYKWNGVSWDSHTRLSTGLPVGTGQKYTCISYYIGSQLYLILGNVVGDWNGFYWNGFSWIEDVNIVTGLADTGSWSRASIYYLENKLNIIAGDTLALNGYSKDK